MDEAARPAAPAQRTLRNLAALAVVLAGLKLAAGLLVPIAFAVFLAVLSLPLFRRLLARGVPVALAIFVTCLVLLAGLGVFGVLLMGSLGELREVAPAYARTLQERVAYTDEWWQRRGVSLREWVPPRWREPQRIAELLGGAIRGTAILLSEITIVFLLLVFMLGETAAFPRKLARLPPELRASLRRFGDVSRELQRYLVIKTGMSALIGLCAGLWLAVLDVDFAVLCGLVAFAFHFVPNVGAAFAAAPAMLIAFLQHDPLQSVLVAIGYGAIGLVLGNLVEPALLGRRLGLSTLAVFSSLLVWGWLWGPLGMFLSVPLTMAFKMALGGSGEWGWLAVLLDAPTPRGEDAPSALAPGGAETSAGAGGAR
jgi:predicted PurR-regulated permease PerM